MTRYESQAKAAVEAGREDLARLALERKQEVAARQAELEASIASVSAQVDSLKQNESALDRKIALFTSKKEELKAIYDSSKAQLEVREAVTGISEDLADVGNTIQRAEARIREMKSRADAIDELVDQGILSDVLEPRSDDIDRELARIGRRQAIDKELERLKAEVGHE
jgi:phage shock protein A